MLKNQLKYGERKTQGKRYDDEIKNFALTLYLYSPRAYKYVRSVFYLPHSSSLTEWTSSINCEPSIFIDVLKSLSSRIRENPTHGDCLLICDARNLNYQLGIEWCLQMLSFSVFLRG